MEFTENKLFAVVAVAVVAVAVFAYLSGPEDVAKTTTTTSGTTSSTSSTSTSTSTTTTTIQERRQSMATSTTSSTATTTSTTLKKPDYFDRFREMGYRHAYLDIDYFCPSCVPAVAQNLADEAGIVSKSMSYRQKISWIIYDPDTVSLDRVVELAGASGGVTLINDTQI